MLFLSKFCTFVFRLNCGLCQLVSWLTLVMVVLTTAIVVLRYGFGLGWIAMQETVIYMHAAVFLLGSAHTLKLNEHVRVDVWYRDRSERGKALTDMLGGLFLALPVNLFILFVSWDYVAASWRLGEASQQVGGLPLLFLFKSFILLFALSLSLQVMALVVENASRYFGWKPGFGADGVEP